MADPIPLRPPPKVAKPSPSLWGIAGILLDDAIQSPKRFERRVKRIERFIEVHRECSTAMRLRGAEYDEALAESREEFAAWFAGITFVIRSQTQL